MRYILPLTITIINITILIMKGFICFPVVRMVNNANLYFTSIQVACLLEVRAHRGVFSCILLENKNINYVNSRGFVPPQSFTIKNILESATGKWNLEQNLQNPMCEHEQWLVQVFPKSKAEAMAFLCFVHAHNILRTPLIRECSC